MLKISSGILIEEIELQVLVENIYTLHLLKEDIILNSEEWAMEEKEPFEYNMFYAQLVPFLLLPNLQAQPSQAST